MPALLWSTATPPCVRAMDSNAVRTESSSDTSHLSAVTPLPTCSATARAVSRLLSRATTRAPCRASAATVALPIPPPAPVTTATAPSSRKQSGAPRSAGIDQHRERGIAVGGGVAAENGRITRIEHHGIAEELLHQPHQHTGGCVVLDDAAAGANGNGSTGAHVRAGAE